MTRGAAALLTPLLAALAAPLAAQETDDGGAQGRLYALPETREARAVAVRAEEHALAARWSDALHDLQRLIEEHRADVLAPGWREDVEGGEASAGDGQEAYLGAAAWAAARLRTLPEEARALYRDRHRRDADLALELALVRGDRRALASVARRWPVADAAARAWWALGDLELERGHPDAAARAWERARDAGDLLGLAPTDGHARRFEVLRALTEEGRSTSLSRADGAEVPLHLPGPGEGGGHVPLAGADSWTARLPSGPFDGEQMRDRYNLFPVRVGDRLLVATGMELVCLDAHTGATLWRSGEARGWALLSGWRRADLFQGVDSIDALVAPAAAGWVAVAALQLPWARLPNTDYQVIPITTSIPERRLFAYDLATGERLWDHAPRATENPLDGDWDGDSGTYAEVLSVAGPPVIASSRVIVPGYRLQGRVDYQLACYDLATGARLWSTPLVSGQRETNMFGRHEEEFAAPPVRVVGDRVVALTQLGTVAALDLFTGAVLWQAPYEQVPLPGTHGWEVSDRRQYWRNAPPVVADGAVVAAPVDSEDLLAIDLEDGARLWTQSYHRWSSPHHRDANVLLGADRDTVYLGGKTLVALQRPGGLGGAAGGVGPALIEVWRHVPENEGPFDLHAAPRALLGKDGVLVPTSDGLGVLGRADGAPRAGRGLPWSLGQQGNVLAGDGAVFSMSGDRVHGFFDWQVLLSRARDELARRPGEREPALSLARLLLRRGETALEAGGLRAAREDLDETDALLRPLLEAAAGLDPEVAALRHRGLRAGARAAARLAEEEQALALLAEALELAVVPTEVLGTLLEREELLRAGSPEAWLACLDALETRVGDLYLPPEHVRFGPEPHLLEALAEAEATGWSPAASALPVRLWVRLERSFFAGSEGDAGAELSDLHAVIAEDGAVEVFPGTSARALAVARVDARLAAGVGDAYAPFERRAQERLEAAVEARDAEALDEVARLYPHAAASRAARSLRLDWATAEGDAGTVAALVHATLSAGAGVTEDDARSLARLAGAMGAIGNHAFQRGLLDELAAVWPQVRVLDAAGDETTVLDLLLALPDAHARTPRPDRTTFDEDLAHVYGEQDRFAVVGEARHAAAADARVVLARGDRLEGWDPSAPTAPTWAYELPYGVTPDYWVDSTRLAPERALVAAIDDVLAVDTRTGAEAWRWHAGRYAVHSLETSDGVALALLPAEGERARLQALDLRRGIELWSLSIPLSGTPHLFVRDGRAIVLGSRFSRPLQVAVVDLYRGRLVASGALETALPHDAPSGAWIADGHVVLPAFLSARDPERNRLIGVDLATAREAWSLSFGAREEVFAVARHEDETYVVTRPVDMDEARSGGAIARLDDASGALTPIVSLQVGEEVLGLTRGRRTELAAPELFLADYVPGGRSTTLTAVDLPQGERWVQALPVSYEELYHVSLPAPATSSRSVALAYTTVDRQNELEHTTHFLVLDRATGKQLDHRRLDPALGEADGLTLFGLGPSLVLVGRRQRGPGRLEIWSDQR